MADFCSQFYEDRRLTTAQIFYHLPDHPALLQEFIWQDYDLAPDFPALHRFLRFWVKEIEGKLHSVYVARYKVITASEMRLCDFEGTV